MSRVEDPELRRQWRSRIEDHDGTDDNEGGIRRWMRLAEAVYLARLADYYVCHTGSLQHKIAWFHNTPGTVHANAAGLQAGAAKWLADQLEGGRPPRLLSSQLVSDLDTIRTTNQVARNRDYRINDIAGAVAEILDDLSVVTGPSVPVAGT